MRVRASCRRASACARTAAAAMLARKTCVLRFSLCFNAVVVVLFVGPHLAPRQELEPQPAPPAAGANGLGGLSALSMRPPPSPPPPAPPAPSQQQQQPPSSGAKVKKDSSTAASATDAADAGAGRDASGAGQPPPAAAGPPVVAAEHHESASAPPPTARTQAPPGPLPTHVSQGLTELASGAGAGDGGEGESEGGGGGDGEATEDDAAAEAAQPQRTLQEAVPCHDRDAEPRTAQRSDFWVLYNYVGAKRRPHCWESITYTTHADYTFLDNLQPLLERWRGPVSLAMHAPGADFKPTLESIRWARACLTPLVAEHVTFHVFFGTHHVPPEVPSAVRALLGARPNCSAAPPWTNVSSTQLYKARAHILYPVNVGRNVARESALTHFVLPSDIELYPSPGLISAFLEMIRRGDPPLRRPAPKVFPLSIFEVEKGAPLPENKTHLVSMLKSGAAIPFHKKLCPGCHNVPHGAEWQAANVTEGLHIFHIGKRLGYHVHWEPIFIGTHRDPLYDERLSWEGKSDKMTQGYALCVLDYEFHILDNAFLVHKPGIKTLKKDPQRAVLSRKTNALIKKVIFPELKILYGVRKGCAV